MTNGDCKTHRVTVPHGESLRAHHWEGISLVRVMSEGNIRFSNGLLGFKDEMTHFVRVKRSDFFFRHWAIRMLHVHLDDVRLYPYLVFLDLKIERVSIEVVVISVVVILLSTKLYR